MATVTITMDHCEVQAALAALLRDQTGMEVMPEEIAFFANASDNPHGAQEVEISLRATAR